MLVVCFERCNVWQRRENIQIQSDGVSPKRERCPKRSCLLLKRTPQSAREKNNTETAERTKDTEEDFM
jgi:hypothetical protein